MNDRSFNVRFTRSFGFFDGFMGSISRRMKHGWGGVIIDIGREHWKLFLFPIRDDSYA
jgi:hypothetical protein